MIPLILVRDTKASRYNLYTYRLGTRAVCCSVPSSSPYGYSAAISTKIFQMAGKSTLSLDFGKLIVDQFLLERAEILSKPKKTDDRRGELQPLDVSYLNIGDTDNRISKSKQIDQATSIHASHLANDHPTIGAHVATPLSHLGPKMKDEDPFVPSPGNDHAERREQRRRDRECYGESQLTQYYVRSSC
jgi:hypothetical protein